MGDKINRTSKVSTHNRLNDRDAAPRREQHVGAAASKEGEDAPRKDTAAAYKGFSQNKSNTLDREFESLLLMMEDDNYKIREASGRISSGEAAAEDTPDEGVPSVLGFTVAAATQALHGAGLSVSKLTRRNHSRIPVGRILSQIPGAGSPKKGVEGVHLVVSAGTLG